MSLVTERPALPLPRASGSVREVAALAYPVVLTQMSATLMGVVDSAMVGRLGPTELAAVGFGSVWMWTLFSLFYGTAGAVQTFVSQHDGAGHPERCGAWAWQGFYAVVPAALLLVLALAPNVSLLLEWLGPSSQMRAASAAYVSARLVGEVGLVCWMVVASFYRGTGDTHTPMWITILANCVNVVLDYGLIFGRLGLPAWGVAGAGTATAVAHWLGAAAILALFLRRRLRERYRTRAVAPDAGALRRFLRIGAPMGGQWFLGMTSFAFFTTLVARMGDSSMAASQAFVMLLSISFMQALGLSVAAQTLTGRYRGAGDDEGVRRSYASAATLGIALAACVALLFVSLPGPLLRIFTDDPRVMDLGRSLLLIGALFQLCDAIMIITQGALRGVGDTRWPFLVETAFGWGVFVPLAYLLGVVLGYGLTGAWFGAMLSLAASAAVLNWRFRSGAWRHIRI